MRLAEGGIQFHCQMVIVPGLNDGEVLEQSIADLWSLGDAVLSTAIVPVGLTQFSHLYTGESMNAERANELIAHVERWEERALRERGDRWVFGSDELYMLAMRELPGAEHYGDFVQIENGVGAVAHLRRRVAEGVRALPRHDGRRIGIVTGTAMGGRLMSELIVQLKRQPARTSNSSSRRTRSSGPPLLRLDCSWAPIFAACSRGAPISISR